MENKEIRYKNLLLLIDEAGGVPALAMRCDTDPVYLNQIRTRWQGAKDKSPRGVGSALARKLEHGMGKRPGWMDKQDNEQDEGTLPPDKYAFINRLNLKVSAGNGVEPGHVEVQDTLAFQRQWLAKKGLNPDNLEVYEAAGDSMAPGIENGDVLLVDVSCAVPRNGEIWVLWQDAPLGVRVKRLMLPENGDVLIRSDNPDKAMYPDERVVASAAHSVKTIGKVVWRGG